jgi:hypothetical protein
MVSAAPLDPTIQGKGVEPPSSKGVGSDQFAPDDLVSQGALGHAWKDITNQDSNAMRNWDVKRSMAEARQLEDERAKLLAAPVYQDQGTYKVSAPSRICSLTQILRTLPCAQQAVGRTTGLAGKRHQLSALLQDAHSNRRALEDRIAENKRNKREAGTKYGF